MYYYYAMSTIGVHGTSEIEYVSLFLIIILICSVVEETADAGPDESVYHQHVLDALPVDPLQFHEQVFW